MGAMGPCTIRMAVPLRVVETACFFSNFPNRIRKKRKKNTDARRACAIGSLFCHETAFHSNPKP